MATPGQRITEDPSDRRNFEDYPSLTRRVMRDKLNLDRDTGKPINKASGERSVADKVFGDSGVIDFTVGALEQDLWRRVTGSTSYGKNRSLQMRRIDAGGNTGDFTAATGRTPTKITQAVGLEAAQSVSNMYLDPNTGISLKDGMNASDIGAAYEYGMERGVFGIDAEIQNVNRASDLDQRISSLDDSTVYGAEAKKALEQDRDKVLREQVKRKVIAEKSGVDVGALRDPQQLKAAMDKLEENNQLGAVNTETDTQFEQVKKGEIDESSLPDIDAKVTSITPESLKGAKKAIDGLSEIIGAAKEIFGNDKSFEELIRSSELLGQASAATTEGAKKIKRSLNQIQESARKFDMDPQEVLRHTNNMAAGAATYASHVTGVSPDVLFGMGQASASVLRDDIFGSAMQSRQARNVSGLQIDPTSVGEANRNIMYQQAQAREENRPLLEFMGGLHRHRRSIEKSGRGKKAQELIEKYKNAKTPEDREAVADEFRRFEAEHGYEADKSFEGMSGAEIVNSMPEAVRKDMEMAVRESDLSTTTEDMGRFVDTSSVLNEQRGSEGSLMEEKISEDGSARMRRFLGSLTADEKKKLISSEGIGDFTRATGAIDNNLTEEQRKAVRRQREDKLKGAGFAGTRDAQREFGDLKEELKKEVAQDLDTMVKTFSEESVMKILGEGDYEGMDREERIQSVLEDKEARAAMEAQGLSEEDVRGLAEKYEGNAGFVSSYEESRNDQRTQSIQSKESEIEFNTRGDYLSEQARKTQFASRTSNTGDPKINVVRGVMGLGPVSDDMAMRDIIDEKISEDPKSGILLDDNGFIKEPGDEKERENQEKELGKLYDNLDEATQEEYGTREGFIEQSMSGNIDLASPELLGKGNIAVTEEGEGFRLHSASEAELIDKKKEIGQKQSEKKLSPEERKRLDEEAKNMPQPEDRSAKSEQSTPAPARGKVPGKESSEASDTKENESQGKSKEQSQTDTGEFDTGGGTGKSPPVEIRGVLRIEDDGTGNLTGTMK